MADNPLELSPQDEQRIRERAYHLWDSEGRPHGRAEEYWERARELDGMAQSAGAGLMPNPMAEHGGEIQPQQPVEEAELMENLGEFPDRLSDQGEHESAPMTKKRAARLRRSA